MGGPLSTSNNKNEPNGLDNKNILTPIGLPKAVVVSGTSR